MTYWIAMGLLAVSLATMHWPAVSAVFATLFFLVLILRPIIDNKWRRKKGYGSKPNRTHTVPDRP
jgi:hypothetical protein